MWSMSSVNIHAGDKWSSLFGPIIIDEDKMEHVNNCLNSNIYSYLETSGGQSSYPYLNVVHCLNTGAD